jgi:hypothetical protein
MTAFLHGIQSSVPDPLCDLGCIGSIGDGDYRPPQYLFDSTFDADCPELLLDYAVPRIFRGAARDALAAMPADVRPNFRWFLVGGAGSGSALHRDPLGTAAWNTVVVGEKRWAMLGPACCFSHSPTRYGPPGQTPCQGNSGHPCCGTMAAVSAEAKSGSADPARWFEHCWPRIRDAVSAAKAAAAAAGRECRARAVEATQRAGQTVVVPSGWLHAVVNAAPSVAVTHNWLPAAQEAPLLRALQAGTADMSPAQAAACRRILLARAHAGAGRPVRPRQRRPGSRQEHGAGCFGSQRLIKI